MKYTYIFFICNKAALIFANVQRNLKSVISSQGHKTGMGEWVILARGAHWIDAAQNNRELFLCHLINLLLNVKVILSTDVLFQ